MTGRRPPWPRARTLRATRLAAAAVLLPAGLAEAQDTTHVEVGERPPPPVQAYPEPLSGDDDLSAPVYTCDRACLLDRPDFSLLDLLLDLAPGVSPVRSSFFGGPHHLLDGPGPGSVRVRLDGRELLPLTARQMDLRRISLAYLDEVRVIRRPGGTVVDVRTRRHADPVAYSYIAATTGEPDVEGLQGVFANGLGSAFTVEGAVELLDTAETGRDEDRFDAFGRLSWMPGTDRVGFQLEYRGESVARTGSDTVDIDRRDLIVRARARLGEQVQLEAHASRAELRQEDETLREAEQVELRLAARPGPLSLEVGGRVAGGGPYPDADAGLGIGWRPVAPLLLEAGAEVASWAGGSSSRVEGGAALSVRPVVPVRLWVQGAKGSRPLARPEPGSEEEAFGLPAVDRVELAAASGDLELVLGPWTVRGRASRQEVGALFPFGAPFDAGLEPGGTLEVVGWEVGGDGPILPVGAVVPGLAPIRAEGGYRRQSVTGEGPALYVPPEESRVRAWLEDSFFDGQLRLRLSASLHHRGATLAGAPGAGEPVTVPGYTWLGGDVSFQIADFRFWWRWANPNRTMASEVPGVPFPALVNAFGVRWEFFN